MNVRGTSVKTTENDGVILKQSRIGMNFFVVMVIAITTIQWMTLDMFLPALPVLTQEFGVTEAALNTTISVDLAGTAVGMLIGGTLSDKYGRRPIMLIGLVITGVFQVMCAATSGVLFMAIFRGIGGFSSGFIMTVATAMIKDSFSGERFRSAMSILQAAAIVGPVCAPAIGSFFLSYFSWRWIFLFLGAMTLASAVPVLFTDETWPQDKRSVDSILGATLQLFDILKDKAFVTLGCSVMAMGFPVWAYLGVCSYIMFDEFGVSTLEYTILYSSGCVVAFFSHFLYIFMSRRWGDKRAGEFCLVFMVVSAVALALFGKTGPIIFMLAIYPSLMVDGMSRSFGSVILLDENEEKAGAASAIYGFAGSVMGMLASTVATLAWTSFVTGLFVITAAVFVIALVFWIAVIKKKMYADRLVKK